MSIAVYENADTYELKWKMLMKCLQTEVKLCNKCIKDAVKRKQYDEAHDAWSDKTTVEWVLDEMENIEEKGTCL